MKHLAVLVGAAVLGWLLATTAVGVAVGVGFWLVWDGAREAMKR